MGRGLFSGIVWGIAVTGLVLVLLALVAPAPSRPDDQAAPAPAGRPAPPAPDAPPAEVPAEPADADGPGAVAATDIELPPGSEFNRVPPERTVTLPDAEVEAYGAPQVRAPDVGAEIAEAPLPYTAPAPAPEPVTTGPNGLAPPLSAEAPPDATAEEPAPKAAGESAPAALRGETVERTEAPEGGAQAVREMRSRPEDAVQPEPGSKSAARPSEPTDNEDADASGGAETLQDGLPRVRPLPGAEDATAADAPDSAGEAAMPSGPSAWEDPAAVRVGRLPAVGDPASDAEGPDAGSVPTEGVETSEATDRAVEAPAPELGALARNAMVFSPDSVRPLFSVILIDAGSDGLAREALMTFSFPVTFAIDPTRPDAALAMEAYRAAGYEVVLLSTGLPEGAQPGDLEVTLAARDALLDEAVAVMAPEEGGFQDDRDLTAQIVEFAAESGHGIITHDRGLNTAARLAAQAGVPEATVFRVLDDSRPNVPTLGRMFDRAVFKARQDGHVVLVAHTYPETVTAFYAWALEAEVEEITLSPVSAVLRRP
ncbi:hypothetical protein SAMN05444722_0400 [Rhodovulum sp. ES.010]|uniref:polysaccharide deacteylase family 2 protein n=1 Tax=Rhodovulum sp. ES.010 TaxID=1882821 RepID=UPI00092BDD1A|nr:polysaccharide deacteylase family 2 protein [Rhodovulum sp. ES.010]SIO09590.1 hypothetical protein SAMN05444722_0400 [Rhodovulum sp. ES.010]